MSTENRQLFGGPHDGTRLPSTGEGFLQPLRWNTVPVIAVDIEFEDELRVLVYGAFDGPHLYMEDSEGRLSHVPPAMNGALRMPDTLQ